MSLVGAIIGFAVLGVGVLYIAQPKDEFIDPLLGILYFMFGGIILTTYFDKKINTLQNNNKVKIE
uniref:ORF47 n=1 Tax=Nitrosopumilaceae spindle-shaped virus TaxID=3065433 RepID=A0AAT9JAC2_9VIRU